MDNKYFDKQKQQKAIEWLEKKWPNDKRMCDVCGNRHWTLIDDLVMPLPFVGGNITLGGNAYPHILITCNECGNSKLFNAVIAQIVKVELGEKNGK